MASPGTGSVAAAVVAEGAPPPLAELRDLARGRLAPYKLPTRLACVPELPRNAMGKVQKNVLRERYAGLFD
mgnify:CR=1 FL=1